MLNLIKKIFQEPLFHFLVLGALVYLYFNHSQELKNTPLQNTITIEKYELEALKKETKLQESKLALELLKYRKILLEEAYSLELYKEDQRISSILLEKTAYLVKTDTSFQEPSEEELLEFYNTNLNDYSQLKSFDLYLITLDKNVDQKIIKQLSVISDLLPSAKRYKDMTPELLEEKFGKYIAFKLSHLPQGFWSEPIKLGFGEAIFLIANKKVNEAYPFEEIEDVVYENYKKDFFLKNERENYLKLYNKYTIQEQQ